MEISLDSKKLGQRLSTRDAVGCTFGGDAKVVRVAAVNFSDQDRISQEGNLGKLFEKDFARKKESARFDHGENRTAFCILNRELAGEYSLDDTSDGSGKMSAKSLVLKDMQTLWDRLQT